MDPLGDFIDYAPWFSPVRLSVSDALTRYRAELVGGRGSAVYARFGPGDRSFGEPLDELARWTETGVPR